MTDRVTLTEDERELIDEAEGWSNDGGAHIRAAVESIVAAREAKAAAKAWDEGHSAGANDSGARLGWSHQATNPPYNAGPLPDLTPNPYLANSYDPDGGESA